MCRCPLPLPALPRGAFSCACVHQSALKLKADAIVTRNKGDFERSFVPVLDCDELFALIEEERGIVYGEVELGR